MLNFLNVKRQPNFQGGRLDLELSPHSFICGSFLTVILLIFNGNVFVYALFIETLTKMIGYVVCVSKACGS